ncbi:MAG TPA: methyltransferase domain-containing protein [Candidatus Saccharimonadales bacterium]|nr:methyltransferase domain-containing protein [Candidatus Saccharimonadales bacterium]
MTKFNDYDSVAEKRQQRFLKGESMPHRFVEKPAMEKMLPPLAGQKVLMIGCGTGEESRLLVEKGAKELIGIDTSKVSIDLATKTYPNHQFQVGDMNKLDFDDDEFDFVYSSLAIDYTDSPLGVYREVYRVLKQGGVFQFSVPHPVRWSSEIVEIDGVRTRVLGFSENKEKPRVYGNYNDYALHEHEFTISNGDPIRVWVGPPSMHFQMLKEAGFRVEEFVETKAVVEAKKVDEYYFDRFSRLPQFVLFQALKF